jgi:hypothetical protein
MNRPGLLVVLIFGIACSSSSRTTVDPNSGPTKSDAAAPAPTGEPPPTPDAAPVVAPDAALISAADAAVTPDSADASSGPKEAGGGGGAPAVEAKWSHTGCQQSTLKYPNIDKNMGKFPPGSCPPPDDLPRPCGGDSKIAVMTATSSGHETGFVHPPEYSTDQYMMTRWSSPASGPTAWLSLDLGVEKTFRRIYLAWELSHAADYDVVVSNDGTTWMPLKQVRAGNGYQDILDVEGTARHVRINGLQKGLTDTGGKTYGYSLFDVTICGERP